MSLLHIYDSSFRVTRWIAGRRGGADRHGVGSYTEFTALFTRLRDEGRSFDRILIESHGSPGRIGFGRSTLGPLTWRSMKQAGYTGLARSGARIHFNGCNVAEGPEGWEFLEAAADLFLNPGGGTVFGQTSLGFGNPVSGHVVHLWGETRSLFVGPDGRILERFEQ